MNLSPKKYLSVITLLISLIILTGYGAGGQGSSQVSQKSSSKNKMSQKHFVGTWKLVSLETRRSNGEVTYPMGQDVAGLMMYAKNGQMCVQLMRAARPRFSSDDILGGTPEEKKSAYEGYLAYCGTYEVNGKEGFVTHHVQLSLFPNWIGTDLKQFFEFSSKNRFTLSTPPVVQDGVQQTTQLVWERLK